MNGGAETARRWPAMAWLALWAALMAAALAARPLLPMDETRYLAVAWEMRLGGDFLVPHLNGAAYSHKPPLLFWLINLGWEVFGVNPWSPRLVAPLFGLAALFLTRRLARHLWPDAAAIAPMAPLVLLGGVFWALFTTLTMFDMMLAACALAGLAGVVGAWRRGGVGAFTMVGLAIGVGILAKGPAILVHVLPAALLAPYWGPALGGGAASRSWRGWYAGIAWGLFVGAAMGLAWALPAAVRGGAAYADAILWGQSAGRVVSSFAHGRPWWWYGAVIVPMLLPWIAWPALWRGLGGRAAWRAGRGLRAALADGGVRFCLAWFVPAFVVFSAISGKQLHYLLPELPAAALLAAFLVAGGTAPGARRWDQALPAGLFAVAGVALWVMPGLLAEGPPAAALGVMDTAWGLAVAGAGAAVAVAPLGSPVARAAALAGLAGAAVIAAHLAARPYLAGAFDLAPLALRLQAWERAGIGLAHFGTYHGQFHFLGRLARPMPAIGLTDRDTERWLATNPNGRIVSYRKRPPADSRPLYVQPYRGRFIVVWDAATEIANPGVVERGGEADRR